MQQDLIETILAKIIQAASRGTQQKSQAQLRKEQFRKALNIGFTPKEAFS